jgi:hypothetical protein
MAKWLLLAHTNCADPSREAEYNNWYDNTHLPDVLEIPGFVRAIRYVTSDTEAAPGKFLAAYEIETEDIEQTMATLQERLAKLEETGRISDLPVTTSLIVYREISSLAR